MTRSIQRPTASTASTAAAPPRRRPQAAPRFKAAKGPPAPGLVTVRNLDDSGPHSLRAAVQYANCHVNTTIKFAHRLHGTINLTSGELTITQSMIIDGPGAHRLAVSGTGHSRVFSIGPDAKVTISRLTITGGLADATAPGVHHGLGGGILNQGDLTLKHTAVSHNQATGVANDTLSITGYVLTGGGGGGGIANFGMLTVSDSTFEGNLARGASGCSETAGNTFPGVACGGGLANMGKGTATITDCQFMANLAQAGNRCKSTGGSGIAGDAGGGAIASFGFISIPAPDPTIVGTLTISRCRFSNNQAIGGDDCVSPILPGHSFGGAIAIHRFKTGAELNVSDSTFDNNLSLGGNRSVVTKANDRAFPNMAVAGGLFACGTGTIKKCVFADNQVIGGEGSDGSAGLPISNNGGDARGSGIDLAFGGVKVTVNDCTVKHNRAVGGKAGPGGSGGNAWGSGVAISATGPVVTVTDCTIVGNVAQGGIGDASGPPSNGGNGLGGGVYNVAGPPITVTASLITHNRARDGMGKHGGSDGQGIGGGLYNLGTVTVDPATAVTKNHASTSNDDVYP